MHLPLTGSLKEGDLKVGSNENSGCYAKEVEHLNVYNADEFAVCQAASLVLKTVHDKIVNCRGRSDDIGTVKSDRYIGSVQKLCDSEIVGDGRKREGTVDASVGEVCCQQLGDVPIDEGISEVTKHKHEEGEGHTMANGQDRSNQHQ